MVLSSRLLCPLSPEFGRSNKTFENGRQHATCKHGLMHEGAWPIQQVPKHKLQPKSFLHQCEENIPEVARTLEVGKGLEGSSYSRNIFFTNLRNKLSKRPVSSDLPSHPACNFAYFGYVFSSFLVCGVGPLSSRAPFSFSYSRILCQIRPLT